ncbi:hypothetical protein NQZ68_005150 [Dissostichus eleginoides]|nr:hypothetical protein NQZ68_005150 [Dissostichus eleginoides]
MLRLRGTVEAAASPERTDPVTNKQRRHGKLHGFTQSAASYLRLCGVEKVLEKEIRPAPSCFHSPLGGG